MQRQEEQTKQLLDELQGALQLERTHRVAAEKQLDALRQQARQDHEEAARRLRELTEERDQARARIADLEAALYEAQAMLELQQDDREMLTERAQATAEKIRRFDEKAWERSTNPAEDPFKILCPLCGTYTYANLRYCVRCLGEVATSTPVGARSPNDPPPPPPEPKDRQTTDPLPVFPDPFPAHPYPSAPLYPYGRFSETTGAYEPSSEDDHRMPTVDELLARIVQDQRKPAQPDRDPWDTFRDHR